MKSWGLISNSDDLGRDGGMGGGVTWAAQIAVRRAVRVATERRNTFWRIVLV